jgi:hypothetical protein
LHGLTRIYPMRYRLNLSHGVNTLFYLLESLTIILSSPPRLAVRGKLQRGQSSIVNLWHSHSQLVGPDPSGIICCVLSRTTRQREKKASLFLNCGPNGHRCPFSDAPQKQPGPIPGQSVQVPNSKYDSCIAECCFNRYARLTESGGCHRSTLYLCRRRPGYSWCQSLS